MRGRGGSRRQTVAVELSVTICEMPDDPVEFVGVWDRLQHHIAAESSDLLVLNEAPFARWFAHTDKYVEEIWNAAVTSHAAAIRHLGLGCSVISTAPISQGGRRHNQAFSWTPTDGLSPWRRKAFLPDEYPVYEATWYDAAPDKPDVRTIAGANVGVLTCTEIWKLDWASKLGQLDAHIVATPRATGDDSLDNWLAAGRVAAIVSGAYSVSSNRVGNSFGGGGWVFSPDGDLLAHTDQQQPFATVVLDLEIANEAKTTYPRYATWDAD